MPRLPLSRPEFHKRLAAYTPASERAIRDLQAARGEDATRPEANRFFRRELRRRGRRFPRAIDLGCNNGAFARAVISPFADRVVLVDFSRVALAAARRRLPPRKTEAAIRADLTSGWKRIRALGRFDLVSLCEVIQHMPGRADRNRVFARTAKLLAPGGILLFSNYALKNPADREGFFCSDRHAHLLYHWRASRADSTTLFQRNRLRVVARLHGTTVDAFVLARAARRPVNEDVR